MTARLDECETLNRSGGCPISQVSLIQLGLAASDRPEPERGRRLNQQTAQNFSQSGATAGEPAAIAGAHKPHGACLLVCVEQRQLRARLGAVDLGLALEPGVEINEPDADFGVGQRLDEALLQPNRA